MPIRDDLQAVLTRYTKAYMAADALGSKPNQHIDMV